MATPDIGLAFVLWLSKTRNSLVKQLLLCKKSLQHISIWDIGESGGFFHHYDNQHEQWRYQPHEYPASHHKYTNYYSEDTLPLHRPQAYNFTNSAQVYPVEGSSSIVTCRQCHGSGTVTCGNCNGSGKVTVKDSDGKSKKVRCSNCSGSGQVTCSLCDGEGKLVTYTSKNYDWLHSKDDEPIVSPIIDRFSVRRLISKTHANQGSYPVEDFSREEVIKQAGVYNERIEALIEHAQTCRASKEKEINQRAGTVLFQKCERFYIPIGFINLFVNRKFGQFFIAGNLAHRRSNSPPVRWSLLKLMAWVSLGFLLCIIGGLIHGSLVLDSSTLAWMLIPTFLLVMAGMLRFLLDLWVTWPERWLITDDDGISGWLFVHLLVQAISIDRQGALMDPCYTDLFHLPEENTSKSRNSFFCTIRTGESKTELFLASQRALTLFPSELKTLVSGLNTLVFVITSLTPEQADQSISDLIARQDPNVAPIGRLLIISHGKQMLTPQQLPKTQQWIRAQDIHCQSLPLRSAFDDLQHGRIPPPTQSLLKALTETIVPHSSYSIDNHGDE